MKALAVDTLRLVDTNLLDELPDDLCGKFLDVGILAHKAEEPV